MFQQTLLYKCNSVPYSINMLIALDFTGFLGDTLHVTDCYTLKKPRCTP